jgi:HlyD family secretion protein
MRNLHFVLAAVLASWAMLGGCSRNPARDFQGYVEGEFVNVASSESGRLDQLLVSKGGQVARGAPLFVLESIQESAAVRQAQEQLVAAEAVLQDIRAGKRPQELEVVRAQLEQARADAKKSAADLERDLVQVESGGIARAQLDRSQAAADASAAKVSELEHQLDVANLPARKDQIKAQSAQVASAQAVVEQAQWRLKQKSIMAPAAGLVFDTLYRVGEWVAAGRPVVRLLPPENMKVRFFVPETELGQISIGQNAVVRCDGCAGDIPAKVTYVATEAEYTPPIIYSNETRSKLVFMVEAKPVAEGLELHPGQPVLVELP